MSLTIDEALAFLARVDAGDEKVAESHQGRWDDAYGGNCEFQFPSGWHVVVFNDCGEWDYIDSMIAPDGRRLDVPLGPDLRLDATEAEKRDAVSLWRASGAFKLSEWCVADDDAVRLSAFGLSRVKYVRVRARHRAAIAATTPEGALTSGRMDSARVRELLEAVRDGATSPEDAAKALGALEVKELAGENGVFARVDHGRALRCGFPEVVYAPGKTVDQVVAVARELADRGTRLLVTRVDDAQRKALLKALPGAVHHDRARAVTLDRTPEPSRGKVVVLSAGTADEPVAEEARVTAAIVGARVEAHYDCGVAGLHRILRALPALRDADVAVVVAGMDGALPSVVGGLVECPVIAVPTSVGYGASFQGIGPLLTMLNACAAGVSVVNIDNGFGAGYLAAMIARRTAAARTS